jgi:hypothetical protein
MVFINIDKRFSYLNIAKHSGDTLFYLDPHTVQYFTFVSENSTREETSSYFSSSLLTMNLSKIDESLAFGFYCDSEKDFQDLIEKIVYLNAQESFNVFFSSFIFLFIRLVMYYH